MSGHRGGGGTWDWGKGVELGISLGCQATVGGTLIHEDMPNDQDDSDETDMIKMSVMRLICSR